MNIPVDYATLRMIWWALLGLLLIAFAVMDGFDLGIGILLHRVARTDHERRIVINTIGPVWEGNQVWFILGGGVIFAAWPEIYAVAFSGFYLAMMLVLVGLIIRPVGFKYRSKIQNTTWRACWDICLFISGFLPALIFGVAIGNVLQGVPFYYDQTLQSFYTGSLLDLLNPFALVTGLLSVSMLAMHGGFFLAIKTDGIIQERAKWYSRFFGVLSAVLFAVLGVWLVTRIPGYTLVGDAMMSAPSNPLHKKVVSELGVWMVNYSRYPLTQLAPVCGLGGILVAMILSRFRRYRLAWLMSAISIAGIIITVGVSLFPFILPSSTNPSMSLLVWDASSSQMTLFIMLCVTAIFLPLIVLYTSWVYYVLRGKVTGDYIEQNQQNVY